MTERLSVSPTLKSQIPNAIVDRQNQLFIIFLSIFPYLQNVEYILIL